MQERAPLTARTSIKIAAITFGVLTAISLFVILSLPKTYVAKTHIVVTTNQIAADALQQNHDPYFIHSEFEKIKSSVVLTRAYRDLRQNPQLPDFGKTRHIPM